MFCSCKSLGFILTLKPPETSMLGYIAYSVFPRYLAPRFLAKLINERPRTDFLKCNFLLYVAPICHLCLARNETNVFPPPVQSLPACSPMSANKWRKPVHTISLMLVWLSVGSSAESQVPITNGGSYKRESARDSGGRGRLRAIEMKGG